VQWVSQQYKVRAWKDVCICSAEISLQQGNKAWFYKCNAGVSGNRLYTNRLEHFVHRVSKERKAHDVQNNWLFIKQARLVLLTVQPYRRQGIQYRITISNECRNRC
jgi:hypothetical protein